MNMDSRRRALASNAAATWHHFDSLEHERASTTLGMWTFLATELLLFGALFTAYIVFRWLYPDSFAVASDRLNLLIGAVNTFVLLTSSFTMVLAVHAARAERKRRLFVLLIATAALGLMFLALKAVEYAIDFHEDLVPGVAFRPADWAAPAHPGPVQIFFVLYYVMTGVHAVHLTFGIVVMLILAIQAHRGAFAQGRDGPVEFWGLYWHFVDVVWLFLLP